MIATSEIAELMPTELVAGVEQSDIAKDGRPAGHWSNEFRAGEFFAGIGLVRRALEEVGVKVVFANDISPVKKLVYVANFGDQDFILNDIAALRGDQISDIDLATASFPCTDLSLAGNRAGLDGAESGTFWRFADILEAMGDRRPPVILLENVSGLGTSRDGRDLRLALLRLNELGYVCDLLQLDAKRWVPQSRPRVFVVGALEPVSGDDDCVHDEVRPRWISDFVSRNSDLRMMKKELALPAVTKMTLDSCVERIPTEDHRWWDGDRLSRFWGSLSTVQMGRVAEIKQAGKDAWRTAYRRTRAGKPVWEIRADEISGCLRTARGGSSRQALVQFKDGEFKVRWMTSREYAALMGAPDHLLDSVSENQALFGLGDAVCVPVVKWLLRAYIVPLLRAKTGARWSMAG